MYVSGYVRMVHVCVIWQQVEVCNSMNLDIRNQPEVSCPTIYYLESLYLLILLSTIVYLDWDIVFLLYTVADSKLADQWGSMDSPVSITHFIILTLELQTYNTGFKLVPGIWIYVSILVWQILLPKNIFSSQCLIF